MEEKQYKLKKLLEQLEKIKGRHTELVSVYVPAGSNIFETINRLKMEEGTAENIKSKGTRKNVVTSLEKIIQYLRNYTKTPASGLAVFCGNVSEKEGVDDIKIWAIEPPEPLYKKDYWCDQRFQLEPLQELVKEKEVYGLMVIDSTEASFALLKGKKMQMLGHFDSPVPSKMRAGGQSAARFGRVREGLLNDHMKKAAANAKAYFADPSVRGLIVGGPGPIKDIFLKEEFLPGDLKKRILGVKDVGYTGEHGLEELINRSQDLLKEAAVAREKQLVKDFFEELQKNTGTVTYGFERVRKAIEMGAAELILMSEDLEWKEVEYLCTCGYGQKLFVKTGEPLKCAKCGKEPKIMGELELLEAMEGLVKTTGAKLEIISRDTPEGEKLHSIGGIGAMLRYKAFELQ